MAELNGVTVEAVDLQQLALVNYGHFTSMRVDDQRVRGLERHLDRLVDDCRVLFNADLARGDVRRFVRQAVGDRQGSFVVRVTVFDPTLDLGMPSARGEPKILVTTRPAAAWPLPPLRIQSAIYVRELPKIKHVGLFGALWHRRVAQLNGFDDVVFRNEGGFVSEGGTWNVGFYDGEKIVWPDADVLPGVTMHLVSDLGVKCISAPVSVDAISGMQAAFATNTTIGVRPINVIDDVVFPSNSNVLMELQRHYAAIVGDAL